MGILNETKIELSVKSKQTFEFSDGLTMATEMSWENKFYDLQNRYNISQKRIEELEKERLKSLTKNVTNNTTNNTISKKKKETWDLIYDVYIFSFIFRS